MTGLILLIIAVPVVFFLILWLAHNRRKDVQKLSGRMGRGHANYYGEIPQAGPTQYEICHARHRQEIEGRGPTVIDSYFVEKGR